MAIKQKIQKIYNKLQFEFLYWEMKYRVKRVISGKEKYSLKNITSTQRCIGKSVALARLAVKYDIPIITRYSSAQWYLTKNIPHEFPKYFHDKKPEVYSVNDELRGRRFGVVLVEEGVDVCDVTDKIAPLCSKGVVGYQFIL